MTPSGKAVKKPPRGARDGFHYMNSGTGCQFYFIAWVSAHPASMAAWWEVA